MRCESDVAWIEQLYRTLTSKQLPQDNGFVTSEVSSFLTVARFERHDVANLTNALGPLVKHPLTIHQSSRLIASEPMLEDKGTKFASSQFIQSALS